MFHSYFLQLAHVPVPSTVYLYSAVQTQGNSKCFTRAIKMTQEDVSTLRDKTIKVTVQVKMLVKAVELLQ